MTFDEVMEELRANGSESIKKVLVKHGAREPFYGVKVEYLKTIEKRVKVDHELALQLYATGVSDAMYLAGLIADDARMTEDDLQRWVDAAYWSLLSESTVPWVAAGSPAGWEIAHKWINSPVDTIACAGWRTLSSIALITPDDRLDIEAYRSLLTRVKNSIHSSPNRVRASMNGFVGSIGTCIAPLTEYALACSAEIGAVMVDMGDTACKIPDSAEVIRKVQAKGQIGKKRKTAKC